MYNTATTSPASKDYYLDQVLSYLKGQTPKSAFPSHDHHQVIVHQIFF